MSVTSAIVRISFLLASCGLLVFAAYAPALGTAIMWIAGAMLVLNAISTL